MKIQRIKSLVAMAVLAVSSFAVQANDDLVKAMMEVYAEELAANPQDYRTYYSRAMAYFGQGKMDEAMSDIDNAIKYFPRKETDDLAQAYLLRGKIYTERGELKTALTDLNSALRLSPNHRVALTDRGNLLCRLEQYDMAKMDYTQLLRIEPRNQAAYMGLARIEAQSGNSVRAKDLLAQAVNFTPQDPRIYLERSEVYKEMNMMPEAVDDLVYAVSLDAGRSGAIQQLMAYSDEMYSSVIDALSRNISRYPRQGMLYYVRATIYRNHYDYVASLRDWNTILEKNFFNFHTVYYNRALCLSRLGRFDAARSDINRAIEKNGEDAEYYRLLAEIERGSGNLDAADKAIRQAAIYNPADMNVCLERGMIAYDNGIFEQTIQYYEEAALADPKSPLPYLMLGYVREYGLENSDDAAVEYNKVLALEDPERYYADNLKGIAYAKLCNIKEVEAWERAVNTLSAGKMRNVDYFYLACMYSNVDVDKAISYLEKALDNGFGDYYRIHIDRYSPVTLSPIRHLSQYSNLMHKYRVLFGQ